jgi:putative endonuclease
MGGGLAWRLRAWIRARVVAYSNDAGRSRSAKGRVGERIAARRLWLSGYRIVARNFRAAGAEIDIVAVHRDALVFVEVKRRLTDRAGTPEEAVDEDKRKKIRRAARVYMNRHRAHTRAVRFDVVAISGRWPWRRVTVWKDAF